MRRIFQTAFPEFTLAAFLDIEGAFNNVTSSSIIESMLELDERHDSLNLVVQIITTRKITSVFESTTINRYVARSTPQGAGL